MGEPAEDSIHIVPFGVERDRIVQPVIERNGDQVLLIDYLVQSPPSRPAFERLAADFERHGIDCVCREASISDVHDAVAVLGESILSHQSETVLVNLATGNKILAVGAMIAAMAFGARPYYVAAEQYGSHHGPVPRGVQSVETVASYPISRPERQQVRLMQYIATSDRETATGRPYRIKHELIEFSEREGLPFIADYDGNSRKGKYRRLESRVLSTLRDRGFVEVEQVGTQRHVFLTQEGRNTLRAFGCLLD